jgi:NAD(P)-dependent dehydrogenase (short-subunit alcohol dehydrogenase family)
MNSLGKAALMMSAVGAGAWVAGRMWRQAHDYDLRGKVALVTGGSRGLGLVMARILAERCARVAVCARDPEELDRARDDIAGRGGPALAVPCDLTGDDQARALVERVEGELGPLDMLVNNASIIQVGPLEAMTLKDFEEAMAANFWSTLHTTLAALPSMRRRQEGRIVNISSIAGKVSVPHLLPYSCAKFAVTGFSEGLRAEAAKDGIVVTTVCPGLMRTGSPRHGLFKGNNEAEYAWFSISDSLPLLTVCAETAAGQILNACARGEAELVISLPAQLVITVNSLFPELTARVLELVNRLLPAPGDAGKQAVPGMDSPSAASPSVLTTLTETAAQRNNEMRRTPHDTVKQ